MIAAGEDAGRGGSVVEARMVRALARAALGDASTAREDLAAAIAAGVPVGYCRLFLDEGEPMAALLDDLARSGDERAKTLLDARRTPAAPPSPGGTAIETLSERELEVLRLLTTELSGPEIARRLFVSINTLRTHTKHIFTKLDVTTRRAAVRRAVELGLL